MSFAFFELSHIKTVFSNQSSFDVGKNRIMFVDQSCTLIDHLRSNKTNSISLFIVDEKTIAM